ncbi:MAG TPA: hypothetical protein VFW23_12140 [Tepidisphaeraceae bacterium]|nr:hypothetical protein [Tepidisphaeraceae bacterium]
MTLSHYVLRPRLRDLLLQFLVHKNPFYLLSALSMIAGCFAINSDLSPHAGELGKLLYLLAILNGYEAIVIALGLYLIKKRKIIRDGRTLLLIEAPFLVDLIFLNAEAGSVAFHIGIVLNFLALFLALLKAGIVLRVLNGRISRADSAFIAAELATLFMLPSAFKWLEHHGAITATHFYLAWWVVGLLLISYEVLGRCFGRGDTLKPGVGRTIRHLYVALPIVSLIAHLGMLHWVYGVGFVEADLSPIFLGAAVAAHRIVPTAIAPRVMALVMAALLSANQPELFAIHLTGKWILTPGLLMTATGYLAFVYTLRLRHALCFLSAGFLIVMLIWSAPMMLQLALICRDGIRKGLTMMQQALPKTSFQWGMTALTGAFAFLALGAALSLRHAPAEEAPEPSPAT